MDFHQVWPIFILAMAISIDGFAVGITYGMRKIKIGFLPLLLIGGISTFAVYLTSSLGVILANIIGLGLAKFIGSIILMSIGIWIIYNTYNSYNLKEEDQIEKPEKLLSTKHSEDEGSLSAEKKVLLSLEVKSLGLIVNILKEPTTADFDKSGSINLVEALFLGIALALDAIGTGLGAGMTGFSGLMVPIIIGVVNLLFVGGGFVLGEKLGNFLPEYFKIIPGFVIIFLGIINFF